MKIKIIGLITSALLLVLMVAAGVARGADTPLSSLIDGYRLVEVASVADAMEQLYGQRIYMSHEMRPLTTAKFAGPAVTVLLKKEEHQEGAKAQQGMLDAIDEAPAGSVYVMELEDGGDYAGIGGLMSTAMKYRGLAGAIVDGGVRDTPHIMKLQFPVFSRGIVPSTTVNHYRFAGMNVPIQCAGVRVNAGDIIAADMDGVVVVPKDKAADVLKKAQQLDEAEHSMYSVIEKYKSIREAVARFGRL
ncbi:MAG TPA: RraA family protein [Bryobacteraceae bacterium]|nr:RraA family protein [Bryobacteraceae bacterium]